MEEQQRIKALQDLINVLNGTSFAMYEAKRDRENYNKYVEGLLDDFSDETLIGMKILDILIKLGYSISDLGTYLYKDVIFEVYNLLQNVSCVRRMDLLEELNNKFSNFYHSIAREWKEMGIKSFHLYIQESIKKIDNDNIDKNLYKSVYGDEVDDNNYGLNAFKIASYVSYEYLYKNKKLKNKKLSKLSNDMI